MNYLQVGRPKPFEPERGYICIADEVLMDGDVFDPTEHSFNSLHKITVRKAREFATAVYDDSKLMTYRDGKRALTLMLKDVKRIDQLPEIKHKGYEDARDTMDDVLLDPLVKKVLCGEPNFSFRNRPINVVLNRAKIGDDVCRLLGTLIIQQASGTVMLYDAGFYLRPFHASLIRQNRLKAHVYTLDDLDPSGLRGLCLRMDKSGNGVTFDDAEVLAKAAKLIPHTNEYNDFLRGVME